MQSLDQFEATWNGKPCDFDKAYGYQCMDIVEQYNQDCVNAPRLFGNAVALANNPQSQYYDFVPNSLFYIPPRGAIAVWNNKVGGGDGHAAIVLNASLMTFTSFDQNWPDNTLCHEQSHSYVNVAGFLVAKAARPNVPVPSANPALDAYKLKVRTAIYNAKLDLDSLQ
jgi:hypothetical protein